MTNPHFKKRVNRAWNGRLRRCLFSDAREHFAATWSGPKTSKLLILSLAAGKNEYGWKFFRRVVFPAGPPTHFGSRSGEAGGGGGVPYETAHLGPCTAPHFPNRGETLRPPVASRRRQSSPRTSSGQDFLVSEAVSQKPEFPRSHPRGPSIFYQTNPFPDLVRQTHPGRGPLRGHGPNPAAH